MITPRSLTAPPRSHRPLLGRARWLTRFARSTNALASHARSNLAWLHVHPPRGNALPRSRWPARGLTPRSTQSGNSVMLAGPADRNSAGVGTGTLGGERLTCAFLLGKRSAGGRVHCLRELCVHILLAKAPDRPSGWASKCICAGQRGGPSGDRTPNPRIKRTCVPRPVLSG